MACGERTMRPKKPSKSGEKRIPQRGLGVAQLEKLRLEEQHKEVTGIERNHQLVRALILQNQQQHHGSSGMPSIGKLALIAPMNISMGCESGGGNSSCLTHDSSHSCFVLTPPEALEGLNLEGLCSFRSKSKRQAPLRSSSAALLAAVTHHHSAELPMMSLESCGAMQMEPPSNQIYCTNTCWTEEDPMKKKKRLAQSSQEDLLPPKSTSLELFDSYPSDMFRNALSSPPVHGKFQRQTTCSLASGANIDSPDLNSSYDSGYASTPKASSLGHTGAKDSCSSTGSLQSSFQMRCKGFKENDISSKESSQYGDFLSLGLFSNVKSESPPRRREQDTTSERKRSSDIDRHMENGFSTDLHLGLSQDQSTKTENLGTYQFGELLAHASSNGKGNSCSSAVYRFICYESNEKDSKGSHCHASRMHADLDLTLSL